MLRDKNVAFIPVRGGSKSISLKNIRELAGKPLVYWAAKAANNCKNIDRVYIATDSEKIRETVESFKLDKVCVIGRSADSASDIAATEIAMLEFAMKYEFENIVLVQATSPLITSTDLEAGFSEFYKPNTDSVLSVVKQKRFQWEIGENGLAEPINYNVFCRPRRQDFNGFLVENGAFYITGKKALLESKSRLSGNIRVYEMNEDTYFEVDEPGDWIIIEKQLEYRLKKTGDVIPEIRMFLTDCDGCLTDGGMYYSENGDELKKFNTLDGMGIQLLHEKGIITGIITGENLKLNERRANKLNIDILRMGIKDKADAVRCISKEYKIPLENIAYVGDDINDLETVKMVGFGCAVNNSVKAVKDAADYVTKALGGNGAIREVVELLLK